MQRELGDQYVKNEFKLHKSTDNPLYIVGFLASWQDYLHMITRGEWEEGTLSTDLLEKMSPEQVTQLYELMKEAEQLKSGGEWSSEGCKTDISQILYLSSKFSQVVGEEKGLYTQLFVARDFKRLSSYIENFLLDTI